MTLRFPIVCSSALCAVLAAGCDAPAPEPAPTKDSAGAANGATSSTAKSSVGKAPKPVRSAKPKPPRPNEPAEAKGPFPASTDPALTDPSKAAEPAPEDFHVKFETTAGDFEMDCHRSWAPKAADRFYNLVKIGFYDDVAFFRVLPGFVAQFGLSGLPQVNAAWESARIPDDAIGKQSNTRGTLTFATAGKDTRTTQIFINYADNASLDPMGFTPFGKLRDAAAADKLESSYGDGPPRGSGPSQAQIQSQGNAYLRAQFPKLDYIRKATLQ